MQYWKIQLHEYDNGLCMDFNLNFISYQSLTLYPRMFRVGNYRHRILVLNVSVPQRVRSSAHTILPSLELRCFVLCCSNVYASVNCAAQDISFKGKLVWFHIIWLRVKRTYHSHTTCMIKMLTPVVMHNGHKTVPTCNCSETFYLITLVYPW